MCIKFFQLKLHTDKPKQILQIINKYKIKKQDGLYPDYNATSQFNYKENFMEVKFKSGMKCKTYEPKPLKKTDSFIIRIIAALD
jgi:hypothetical protein